MQLSWPPAGRGTALSSQEIVISQHLLLLSLQASTHKHLNMYTKQAMHWCMLKAELIIMVTRCLRYTQRAAVRWPLLAHMLYAKANLRCHLNSQQKCSKSLTACELGAGCDTWYVQPHCDEQLGVALGVHPSSVQQAVDAAGSAGKCVTAVLVVSPTYFGACSDISGTACMFALSYMLL